MELPEDILVICENACESWKHANDVMNQPYAPMHEWPIKQKNEAIKILNSYNLGKYILPDSSKYPLLYNYMMDIKREEEIREQKRLKELTPEFQLKKKEDELKILDSVIKTNERNIDNLKFNLINAENNLNDLLSLYKTKQEEIMKFKEKMFK